MFRVEELSIDAFKRLSVSATFSVDGEERLGSLHFASLHVPAIGSPTPLCQVSGFPGLELLWGFRRPGARALKAILDFSTISHPSMV